MLKVICEEILRSGGNAFYDLFIIYFLLGSSRFSPQTHCLFPNHFQKWFPNTHMGAISENSRGVLQSHLSFNIIFPLFSRSRSEKQEK